MPDTDGATEAGADPDGATEGEALTGTVGEGVGAGEGEGSTMGAGVGITGTGGGGSRATAPPTTRLPTRIPASSPVPIASLLPMLHERTSTIG